MSDHVFTTHKKSYLCIEQRFERPSVKRLQRLPVLVLEAQRTFLTARLTALFFVAFFLVAFLATFLLAAFLVTFFLATTFFLPVAFFFVAFFFATFLFVAFLALRIEHPPYELFAHKKQLVNHVSRKKCIKMTILFAVVSAGMIVTRSKTTWIVSST